MIWPQKKSNVQKLEDTLFDGKDVQVFMLRDDLLHPGISGNKWRKLKYNLLDSAEKGIYKIVTVGGPYSNHIAAVAEAGKLFGFDTIGLIRGYESYRSNSTLSRAEELGMEIRFFSKSDYNDINQDYFNKLRKEEGEFVFVPMGGGNLLGMRGSKEIVSEIPKETTHITVACGTGSTMAGIVAGTEENQKVIGFPAMKGGDFMVDEVNKFLRDAGVNMQNYNVETRYHFGGFAKMDVQLADFLKAFYEKHGFVLDGIYNGKMMFGLYKMITQDYFPKGSVITAIHTGGVQGNRGLNERFGFNIPLASD
ncbi:1-aminocyclopropane-1-carboxylate deaminase/D-cysteine desulfhydrase [bacterium SCSIO 12643]|nr:1-aminocyclopropane-1-carboxylate deaminase/D-cysteine desulfhydrase [bacterium SCSIO 12643]